MRDKKEDNRIENLRRQFPAPRSKIGKWERKSDGKSDWGRNWAEERLIRKAAEAEVQIFQGITTSPIVPEVSDEASPIATSIDTLNYIDDLELRVKLLEDLVGDLCKHVDSLEQKLEVKVRNYWQDRRLINECHTHSVIG